MTKQETIEQLKQQLQEEENQYNYNGGRVDMLQDIINQLELDASLEKMDKSDEN